jgi:hypothetical protein
MFIVMTSQKMLAWHNRTSGVMKERSKHIYENISPRIRSSFRLEEAYLSTSKRRHAAAPDPCQYISWAWTNKTLSNSAIVYVYEIAHHSVFELRSIWYEASGRIVYLGHGSVDRLELPRKEMINCTHMVACDPAPYRHAKHGYLF